MFRRTWTPVKIENKSVSGQKIYLYDGGITCGELYEETWRSWEVVSRTKDSAGRIIEILRRLPQDFVPFKIINIEAISILEYSQDSLTIPGWKVQVEEVHRNQMYPLDNRSSDNRYPLDNRSSDNLSPADHCNEKVVNVVQPCNPLQKGKSIELRVEKINSQLPRIAPRPLPGPELQKFLSTKGQVQSMTKQNSLKTKGKKEERKGSVQ